MVAVLLAPQLAYIGSAAQIPELEYTVEPPEPPTPDPVIEEKVPDVHCSCVLYLRSLGMEVYGDAYYLEPNTDPYVGAIALYNYGNGKGHVARVTALVEHEGKRGFWEMGSNLDHCKPYIRFVPFDHPRLKGFMKG